MIIKKEHQEKFADALSESRFADEWIESVPLQEKIAEICAEHRGTTVMMALWAVAATGIAKAGGAQKPEEVEPGQVAEHLDRAIEGVLSFATLMAETLMVEEPEPGSH